MKRLILAPLLASLPSLVMANTTPALLEQVFISSTVKQFTAQGITISDTQLQCVQDAHSTESRQLIEQMLGSPSTDDIHKLDQFFATQLGQDMLNLMSGDNFDFNPSNYPLDDSLKFLEVSDYLAKFSDDSLSDKLLVIMLKKWDSCGIDFSIY